MLISLARDVFEMMVRDSIERQPEEAVGLLGGSSPNCASVCRPLPNLQSVGNFWADPFAQWQAMKQFEHDQLNVVAVYHSHPNGGITMSDVDRSFAQGTAFAHIIVSVHGSEVSLSGYQVSPTGEVSSIDLEIESCPK